MVPDDAGVRVGDCRGPTFAGPISIAPHGDLGLTDDRRVSVPGALPLGRCGLSNIGAPSRGQCAAPGPVQLSGAGPHASISRGCRAAADARTFRFASPEGKRMTGKMKRMSVRRRPGLSRRRRMPVACPSRPIGRRHAPVNSQDAPVSAQCELGDTQCPPSLVPQRFGPHPRRFGRHLPSVVSLAGSHLLGPALFRAADLPRHADLRTAGPVRALLRPRMGGSRGKRGPVSAEVRVRVSPNPNPNPNPNP